RDPAVEARKYFCERHPDIGGVESGEVTSSEVFRGMTREELAKTWNKVVENLKKDRKEVLNPSSALEGALTIRYVLF
ncbi:unnamed protein product, partial [Discosporangium mesarthrocarpum]